MIELVALGCALRDAHLGMGEEGGNNRGEYVRRLAANVDPPLPEGLPWCAMAVQSWWDNAAKDLGIDNPLDAVKLQAYVQSYYDTLASYEVGASDVRLGSIALFSFGGERWDHIGLVVRPPQVGSTLFVTVEGNTSPGVGSDDVEREREGDGVHRKTRRLDAGYRVTFLDPTGETVE